MIKKKSILLWVACGFIALGPGTSVHGASSAVPAHQIGARVGEVMPDGTIYAGVSLDTGKAMYATPADGKLTYTFDQAQAFCAKLDANGHQDWRVPSKGELDVLYQNRDAIGGFDESGSGPAGWYWSSSQSYYYGAWAQRFSDGGQNYNTKYDDSSLRCVR
jgi:hypothetical protein